MTTQQIINLIFSVLGGGLMVAILDWFRASRSEQASRSALYLEEQLRKLYGPLYYLTSLNNGIAEVSETIEHAYRAEYCDKKWSDEESTQEILEKEASRTIDLKNRYSELIAENNDRIVDLLQANYGLIDHQDAELFKSFATHRLRTKIEFSELKPPARIQRHLGTTFSYHSQFVERIKQRFTEKTEKLRGLRRRYVPTKDAEVHWPIIMSRDSALPAKESNG